MRVSTHELPQVHTHIHARSHCNGHCQYHYHQRQHQHHQHQQNRHTNVRGSKFGQVLAPEDPLCPPSPRASRNFSSQFFRTRRGGCPTKRSRMIPTMPSASDWPSHRFCALARHGARLAPHSSTVSFSLATTHLRRWGGTCLHKDCEEDHIYVQSDWLRVRSETCFSKLEKPRQNKQSIEASKKTRVPQEGGDRSARLEVLAASQALNPTWTQIAVTSPERVATSHGTWPRIVTHVSATCTDIGHITNL